MMLGAVAEFQAVYFMKGFG